MGLDRIAEQCCSGIDPASVPIPTRPPLAVREVDGGCRVVSHLPTWSPIATHSALKPAEGRFHGDLRGSVGAHVQLAASAHRIWIRL